MREKFSCNLSSPFTFSAQEHVAQPTILVWFGFLISFA